MILVVPKHALTVTKSKSPTGFQIRVATRSDDETTDDDDILL
jgi:hypothetical protein